MPAERKLAATGPALAKASFISAPVIASVVFKSTRLLPAAPAIAAMAIDSFGPSITVSQSYSPKVK